MHGQQRLRDKNLIRLQEGWRHKYYETKDDHVLRMLQEVMSHARE